MRDIKFRAWDAETKSMVHFDFPSLQSNLFSVREIAGRDDWSNPVMQFTGFCDKEGKEIYEGDILSPDDEDPSRFEVVFEDGAFRKRFSDWPKDLPMNVFDQFDLNHYVVIGNRYENPELLNAE